jgi:hypothetical protein
MLNLPWLEPTVANINAVLKGERSVQVEAKIPNKDIAIIGGVMFLALFTAFVLAMAVTNR